MRVCAGITDMVIGEAPDMSSVVEDVRHRWSSPSIDTPTREAREETLSEETRVASSPHAGKRANCPRHRPRRGDQPEGGEIK